LIHAEKDTYDVTFMCRLLRVPRSSYYAWTHRAETPTQARRRALAIEVAAEFEASRQTSGCRRIAAAVNRRGIACSVGLIADLMRELGLAAVQPRAYKRTTLPGNAPRPAPDLLERNFTATAPGTRLVGDITYLRTGEGWLYLATVIDLATRMVVGWQLAAHMRTTLVTDALAMAIAALPAPAPDPTASGPAGGSTVDTGPTGYASAVERLCQIPGAGPDSVRAVIGEIGLDMSVFGTAQRLCSWAKISPRTVESGRTKRRATTGKGNRYLKAALGQMAVGAAKTDTFLSERYRRLVKRMPKAKARAALARSILVIIFHLLADPTAEFADLGADFYTRRIDKERRAHQLTRQLQALGYTVALTPAA
jgi:putative transposase